MKHITARSLEVVAFTSGFALMAFEMVAARILAPYVGSSIYVWTSVIGAIMASLSIGYYAGGLLADKHRRLIDIAWLCVASAIAVVTVILFYQPILEWIAGNMKDPRLQGVAASLLLFAPTSFLIGIKAPYLAKLKVTSLERTGESVAGLSALNAVGGIVGVFVAGFILFGFIGSRETLAVIAGLLIASSWLVVPHRHMKWRLAISILLMAITFVPVPMVGAVNIDTPTAHYQVREGYRPGDSRRVRVLTSGPGGSQSGMYMDGSGNLVFWYTGEFARLVSAHPTKGRILVLGGGTFTLPAYLADHYPWSQIDVVEIDPELQTIAKDYFHFQSRPNLRLIFDDARNYVNSTRTKYDIVLADVYSDASVPFSMMTREYGEKVAGLLAPHGMVAANVIAAPEGACRPLLDAINGAYGSALTYGSYLLSPTTTSENERNNMVVAYSQEQMLPAGYTPLARPTASYGDNFMPAERLQQACREG